jgi:acetyltransferase-like isoleucine patch superfamily enzyme
MDNENVDLKKISKDSSQSTLRRYARIAVGSDSLLALLRYELVMLVCSGLFGALGMVLRRMLYPLVLSSMGRNISIGRNVTIRGSSMISIGNNVMIDDNCVIDARGEGCRIEIEDDVLVSGGTVIRARNGRLRVGRGSSIGRNCLLGTDHRLEVGEEVLVGAYTYLCAGGLHRFNGSELSVLCQGVDQSKGITVGDGVWLGARVTLLDGVTVGRGSVIGAHSLVNRDIAEKMIAHGSPARVTRGRGNEQR